ncbi:probable glucomannan 4-beta-mannosyltransferase 6 [Phragmites australis]|uniref:probable glucomannan 4-beta-mannosyltransferase 6 n=1 Tax=Phragmites australis TaxID=29695 RepID=UPI002D766A80|nr:probable glucomannan 4-beta-mannosyltransferase 6 [Phragmites australis]
MQGGHALRAVGDVFFPTIAAVVELSLRAWRQVRTELLVPLLRAAVVACTVMSVIVLAEKVFLGTVSSVMKVLRRRPGRMYKSDPIVQQDEEAGSTAFPMVLVQIPMCNEKEVYKLSIGAACRLTWPADRLIVQVLDDSTDLIIKELVKSECEKWAEEGINIKYDTRKDRAGYKAGNLKEGMRHAYVRGCEFVAMFDADFQPAPDFLVRTVPFLVHDPNLALVQTRWKFVNANDCLLTRMQEMSMDYHFKVEQEAGSSLCNFFGYNGTAGVWRTQAIVESGGWEDRTTAEDMDLALRAGLLGWEFVYVGSIKVKSELPSTLKAYRSQQHRWSCGPAVLFKKMFWEILAAKKVSAFKKFYMIYDFFIARRIVSTFFTFFFFSVLIPMNFLFPETQIPTWELIYIPTAITLLSSVGTPRSIHLIILWVLFENVMALHRFKAILIGFFEAGRANEWIVTQKLGSIHKLKSIVRVTTNRRFKDRFHCLEIFIGMFLLVSACYDYLYRDDYFYIFVLPQSIMYFAVGFEFLGVSVSS